MQREQSEKASVAIVGYGWVGNIIAHEMARQGLNVVVLERGDDLDMPQCGHFHGPTGERRPHERTQNATKETFTLRHGLRESALPIRRMGPFLAGNGAGGAGVLWGGVTPRYKPESFAPSERFRNLLSREEFQGLELRDWPIGYDDIEEGYAAFEQIAGVAGPATLPKGAGLRSIPYPLPPAQTNEGPKLFREGALACGFNVAELPVSEINERYTNPLGVSREPCSQYGTTLATPLNTLDPVNRSSGKVTIITGAQVRRVLHDKRRVTGILYVKDGAEFTVTASSYVLAAWTLNNVKLLLLSKIGRPYDPQTGTGVVGRWLSNHLTYGATGFYNDRRIDSSLRTGAGWVISDFENGLSDANGNATDFIGGVQMHSSNLELKPKPDVIVPPGVPRWGLAWKEALHAYAHSMLRINVTGEVVPHRERFVDLDETYRDAWGDPLLRLTYDWKQNERLQVRAMSKISRAILQAAGADSVNIPETLSEHYNVGAYQNSHVAGGAIMGTDPETSVVSPDLKSWDLDNLWVVGASSFPRNPAANPTPTVAALALRAARSIRLALREPAIDSTSSHQLERLKS